MNDALPFRLCSTPKIFNTLVDALLWIMFLHLNPCNLHFHILFHPLKACLHSKIYKDSKSQPAVGR